MAKNSRGSPGPNYLTPEARAKLVRETFEAVATVGFLQFCHEERARGEPTQTEADRKEFAAIMDAKYWQEFQQMTARVTNAQLVEMLGYWKMEANAAGLKEWQQEQRGKGAPTAAPAKSKSKQIDLDRG